MVIFPTNHDCLAKSTILESYDLGAHTKKRIRICRVCSRLFSTIETFKGMSIVSDNDTQIVVKIDKIILTVCDACGINRNDLLGKKRNQPLAVIRQIAMYLCHESGYNYAEIGEVFDRHYSTVIGGCKSIGERKETNQDIKRFLLLVKFHHDVDDERRMTEDE